MATFSSAQDAILQRIITEAGLADTTPEDLSYLGTSLLEVGGTVQPATKEVMAAAYAAMLARIEASATNPALSPEEVSYLASSLSLLGAQAIIGDFTLVAGNNLTLIQSTATQAVYDISALKEGFTAYIESVRLDTDDLIEVTQLARDAALASKTAAAASATAADTARAAAVTAKTASETAKTASETARTGAQTAQTGATTAKTASETARDASIAAKTASETAKGGSEAARDAAVLAKTASETAKTGAETARTGAEAAKTAAAGSATASDTARAAAVVARTGAETAQGDALASAQAALGSSNNADAKAAAAETARAAAAAAKTASETARDGSVAAQTASETAKTGAETAKAGADTAKGAADTARAAAVTAQTAAANSRTYAAEWATKATDSAVSAAAGASGTQYSALHHAAKAAVSATAAATSKTGADTAKTAAETAKTASETARTAAQTAKTAAETAEVAAETAQAKAETAQTAAETARTGAQAAQTASETARDGAVTAKTAAETARAGAEAAAASAAQNDATSVVNAHKADTANPHATTAAQVGAYTKAETDNRIGTLAPAVHTHTAAQISNASADGRSLLTAATFAAMKTLLALNLVSNTADTAKPVSTAQAAAIAARAPAVTFVLDMLWDAFPAGISYSQVQPEMGVPDYGTVLTIQIGMNRSSQTFISKTGIMWTRGVNAGAWSGWVQSATQADLAWHTGRVDNPHGTTAAQVGAFTKAETQAEIDSRAGSAISAHVADKSNPHGTTAGQVGAYTVAEANARIEDRAAAWANTKQQGLESVAAFELGRLLSGDRVSLTDYHSSGAPGTIDFSGRIVRYAGVNGDFAMQQTGTGNISLNGGGGLFRDGFKVHHDGNFDGLLKSGGRMTGKITMAGGAYIQVRHIDGDAGDGATYGDLYLNHFNTGSRVMVQSGMTVAGMIEAVGEIYIGRGKPSSTLTFGDSDHTPGAIHVNSHTMYFGKGDFTYWPLTVNLANGQVNAAYRLTVGGSDVITSATIGGQGVAYAASAGNAATLNGSGSNAGNVAGTHALRDGQSDVRARLFRTEYAAETEYAVNYFVGMAAIGGGESDNYMRPISTAGVRAALSVYTRAEVESRAQAWAVQEAGKAAQKTGDTFSGYMLFRTTGAQLAMEYPGVRRWELQVGGGGNFNVVDQSAGTIAMSFLMGAGGISTQYSITAAGLINANGNITINNAAPTINMYDNNVGSFAVHCNDGLIGFLFNGGWIFRVGTDGNFYTPFGAASEFGESRAHDVRELRSVTTVRTSFSTAANTTEVIAPQGSFLIGVTSTSSRAGERAVSGVVSRYLQGYSIDRGWFTMTDT